jgi:hypothetical protein
MKQINEMTEEEKVAAGLSCQQCGRRIIGGGLGKPVDCAECLNLRYLRGWVDHTHNMLRCPKCKHVFSAEDYADDLYYYGEITHNVSCPECNNTFEVSVKRVFIFKSPKLLPEADI